MRSLWRHRQRSKASEKGEARHRASEAALAAAMRNALWKSSRQSKTAQAPMQPKLWGEAGRKGRSPVSCINYLPMSVGLRLAQGRAREHRSATPKGSRTAGAEDRKRARRAARSACADLQVNDKRALQRAQA